MYKVLLVDDEALTREAISQNVPWEDMGFTLIGSAENGREALSIVEREQPDLVLTDICMPVMDGIALSGHLYEKYPETKVIIISGYDDFEYAKQAIRFEVSNYILKPITSYELTEELEKVKLKIERSGKKEKSAPTLRSHFLTRLVEGTYAENDIEAQMKQLKVTLKGRMQAVVLLEVEDTAALLKRYTQKGGELIEFAVANIAEEAAQNDERIIFFQNDQNKSHLIFAEDEEEKLKNLIQEVCTKMTDTILMHTDINVNVMIGKTVVGVEHWNQSYHSLQAEKEHRFLFEGYEVSNASDVKDQKKSDQMQFLHQIDKLVLMIKLNQEDEIRGEVANLFSSLRASGKEKRQLLVTIQNLVLLILIALEEHIDDKVKEYQKEEFILQLREFWRLKDIERKFLDFCLELSDNIAGKREHVNQKQAIKAMDYIEKNYMNAEMSLNLVCEHLCVSTSYFSNLFKSSTGETFIEALTRVRMEKAKDLLACKDMKTYEVALSVGYLDPHYFSSIFKKRVGMTPTEYVKQLRRGK